VHRFVCSESATLIAKIAVIFASNAVTFQTIGRV